MSETLTFTFVTPEKILREAVEVEEVIFPGYCGELQVLPGHAPLVTTLNEGVVKFKEKGHSEYSMASISWGYCEINPKGIHLLADTAELQEEILVERAELALKRARERLSQAGLLPVEESLKWQRKEKRAEVRLQVAKSSKPTYH